MMWTNIWPQSKGVSGDVKNCKKQFRHQTQLCLSASKYRDGGTNMAYYKNHRSPRFEKMSEVRQWLEGQEKIRHKGENIDHRGRKWSFEGNYLTVEMKVIEDPQAALHVGAGHLPDWLQNQKACWSWICTTTISVFSEASQSIKDHIRFIT